MSNTPKSTESTAPTPTSSSSTASTPSPQSSAPERSVHRDAGQGVIDRAIEYFRGDRSQSSLNRLEVAVGEYLAIAESTPERAVVEVLRQAGISIADRDALARDLVVAVRSKK